MLDWNVTRREDLDGIKLYLGEIGWVMLRASGTEPMLRVYSETTSPATTRRILDETCAIVRRFGKHRGFQQPSASVAEATTHQYSRQS